MPFFQNSPPAKAIMIEQGWPVYLFGSRQSIDGELNVSSVSIASNVATVAVTSWSGPLPVVGSFVSISGAQTNSGLFNVTNQPITAVTLNASQNDVVSISFALTNANIGVTPEVGKVHVRFAAVGEALTSAGGASIAGSTKFGVGRVENWYTAQVYFPTAPSAATVALQGSNTNNDADFVDIGPITITAGRGSKEFQTNFEFVRFNITAVTGSGTVVASINA
jgi:hypothetical protein